MISDRKRELDTIENIGFHRYTPFLIDCNPRARNDTLEGNARYRTVLSAFQAAAVLTPLNEPPILSPSAALRRELFRVELFSQ